MRDAAGRLVLAQRIAAPFDTARRARSALSTEREFEAALRATGADEFVPDAAVYFAVLPELRSATAGQGKANGMAQSS